MEVEEVKHALEATIEVLATYVALDDARSKLERMSLLLWHRYNLRRLNNPVHDLHARISDMEKALEDVALILRYRHQAHKPETLWHTLWLDIHDLLGLDPKLAYDA